MMLKIILLFQAAVGYIHADNVRVSINAPFRSAAEASLLEAIEGGHRLVKRQSCGAPSELTADQQQETLDALNGYRAAEYATNMLQLSYSDEIASVAQDKANGCVFAHDHLYDCEGIRVGQNLYIKYESDRFPDWTMTEVIQNWNDERSNYDYGSNSCTGGQMCGHYTQDVWARTALVGCGYAKCDSANVNGQIWQNAVLVVCDFSPAGNVVGQSPYEAGQPCTNCDSDGTGASYGCANNLCVGQ